MENQNLNAEAGFAAASYHSYSFLQWIICRVPVILQGLEVMVSTLD